MNKDKFVAVVYSGGMSYPLNKSFASANAAEKASIKELGKRTGSYTISKIVEVDGKIGYLPMYKINKN